MNDRIGGKDRFGGDVDYHFSALYSVLLGSGLAILLTTICEACGLYTWIAQIIWEVTTR